MTYDRALERNEYDCSGRRYRNLEMLLYLDGALVLTPVPPASAPWLGWAPDTHAEGAGEAVCAYRPQPSSGGGVSVAVPVVDRTGTVRYGQVAYDYPPEVGQVVDDLSEIKAAARANGSASVADVTSFVHVKRPPTVSADRARALAAEAVAAALSA